MTAPVLILLSDKKDPDDLCEAARPGYLDGYRAWIRFCDNPATETWRYGCQHEHIRTRRTCAEHRPEAGKVGCRDCLEEGHDCPMIAEPVQ